MFDILANSSNIPIPGSSSFIGELVIFLLIGDLVIPVSILLWVLFVVLLKKIFKSMKEDLEDGVE